jgi:beta-glucosidase
MRETPKFDKRPNDGREDRIDRLIGAMTLQEKIGQLTMVAAELAVTGPILAPDYLSQVREGRAGSLLNLWGPERVHAVQRLAVEESRLGIPVLFGFDVIHGHRTVFPSPLGEAAAFDPDLWRRSARSQAAEAAADGIDLVFAPMLDVSRDPRWGRIMEGPGEDPLVGRLVARARIEGAQGPDLAAPDAVAATAKHFVGYGAVAAGREYASVDISERTLHEIYLPPFAAAVAAGVACIMPGFHDLAGMPMTAHAGLLRGLLRERWGFDGVLVSDYAATRELLAHGVAGDAAEAAALALRAGIDIDMMGGIYTEGLPPALESGLVGIEPVDAAVRRVLRLKERLGLFEDPYRRLGRSRPQPRAETRALAREAARRSAVLLRHRGNVLPLAPSLRRIALIGPLADDGPDLLGPWAGTGEDAAPVPLLDGLRAALPEAEIIAEAGVTIDGPAGGGIESACRLAGAADLVILCLGESASMSGEAASRADLGLPGAQRALAEAVLGLGRRTVALIVSGRPLAIGWLAERADAALALWHPGSEAGHAVADLLTGKAEPTGRLPLSWPVAVGQVPLAYAERPTGRPAGSAPHYATRYIDLPNEPLFPFGHGLGYTRFAWRGLTVTPAEFGPADTLSVEVELVNLGDRTGEETVFVFARDLVASVARPVLELEGFAKLVLAPGETGIARIPVRAADLAFPGPAPDFAPRLEPGQFEILAGPSADRRNLLGTRVRLRDRA